VTEACFDAVAEAVPLAQISGFFRCGLKGALVDIRYSPGHRSAGRCSRRSSAGQTTRGHHADRLLGQVERLDPSRHRAGLWDAIRGHDKIWTYMAYGPFADEDAFSSWLASRVELERWV